MIKFGISSALLAPTLAAIISFSPDLLAAEGCDCEVDGGSAVCAGNSVSYSTENQTIGFEFECADGLCLCGKFATGKDYWVAPADPLGSVTITRMTPDATGVATSDLRHGAESDPAVMTGQGFKGAYPSSRMTSVDHSRTITVPHTVEPSTIARPTVVLKSITNDDTCIAETNNGRMCLELVETLTVLEEPPGNTFRPPYFGNEKPLFGASNFDDSFLSELKPDQHAISWDAAIARVKSVHLEHIANQSHRQGMTARLNTRAGSGYEQFRNTQLNLALLKLTHKAETAADQAKKAQLARFIAQLGIDLYFIHKNGAGTPGAYGGEGAPCGAWIGVGGFGGGKLIPILFAAHLLRQSDWLDEINEVLSTRDGLQCFAETGFIQRNEERRGKGIPTFGHLNTSIYSNIGDCSRPNRNCASIGGSDSASYDNYDGLADGDPLGASGSPTAYQACCTHGNWLGAALSVWLTPQVYQSFPSNGLHFLTYMQDRKRLGDSIGFDFASYHDPNSDAAKGFNSGYFHSHFEGMWRAYHECFEGQSCEGMLSREDLSRPLPPIITAVP